MSNLPIENPAPYAAELADQLRETADVYSKAEADDLLGVKADAASVDAALDLKLDIAGVDAELAAKPLATTGLASVLAVGADGAVQKGTAAALREIGSLYSIAETDNAIDIAVEGSAALIGEALAGLDLRATEAEGDIAAVSGRVETVEANQVTGVKTYASWSSLAAVTGAVGDGAEVLLTGSGTHTDPVTGATVADAGRYIWSASPAGWKWVSAEAYTAKVDKVDFTAYKASAVDLPAIRSRSQELSAVLSGGMDTVAKAKLTGLYGVANGFKGWAIGLDAGTDVTAGDYFDGFGFDIALAVTATKLTLNVYTRVTAGSTPNGLPGQTADTLLMSVTSTLAEAGVAAADNLQRAIFRFPRYLLIEAGLTYVFAFEARDDDDVLVVSGCGQHTSSGYPQRRIGYYRHSDGTWLTVGSSTVGLNWNLLRDNIQNIIEDISASRKAVLRMIPETDIKFSRPGTPIFPLSLGLGDWSAGILVGTDMDAGTIFDTATFAINPHADAVTAIIKLWRRDTPSNGAPGTGDDSILDSVFSTVTDLGLVTGEYHDATMTFRSAIEAAAGEIYLLEVDLLDAAGSRVAFGVNAVADAGYTQAYRRGYYRNAAGLSLTVASGFGVSVSFGRGVLVSDVPPETDLAPFDRVRLCSATVDDSALSATIDPQQSTIDRRGTSVPFGGTVSFTAPTSGTVTDEARTITFTDKGYGTTGVGVVTNANISDVVVKDASTSAVLVEGTDYAVNYEHGKVVRVTAGTDRNVLVSYTWSRRRYDMVALNPETLALSVTAGTEANRDAQERLPARASANQVPLFMARVTADGVNLVPLWDAEDGRPRKYLPALERQIERGRRHLRPILKKLETGSAVTVAGYGDSIVGCPGISASPTTPNGTTRDLTTMFSATGSDLVSALTLYDQGDGGGAIHHHASHIRRAIDALAERYSSTITYLNYGIGGTTSGSTDDNGSATTRLGAVTASGADLVIIGFGMNELGSANTAASMTAIVQACLTAGQKVIIIGVPRPNTVRGTSQDASWRYTSRALARVADYLDVAFVDFMSLYDDDCLSGLGISKLDCCGSNYLNHPSLHEYQVMGAQISRLLAD